MHALRILKLLQSSNRLFITQYLYSPAFSSDSTSKTSYPIHNNSDDIKQDFLKHIVCPLTKKPLRYDKNRKLLINDELSIGYKVTDGIPNMIPTDAVKLEHS